jgi:hypothetical protein
MPVQPAPVPPIPTPLPAHLVPSSVMISSLPALGTDVDGITRQFYPNNNPTRRLVVPGSQAGTATNTVQISTPQAMGLTQGVYSSPQITVDNNGNITVVKNAAQSSGGGGLTDLTGTAAFGTVYRNSGAGWRVVMVTAMIGGGSGSISAHSDTTGTPTGNLMAASATRPGADTCSLTYFVAPGLNYVVNGSGFTIGSWLEGQVG